MQPPQPPFQPPTAVPPADPSGKVAPPAIALIVTGVVGILIAVGRIFARTLMLAALASNPELSARMGNMAVSGAANIVFGIFGLATSALVIYGALQMQKLQGYGLSVAAAIIAMLPCVGPCCCVGLPVGIWSLVVLMDPPVKASFRS